MRKFLTDSIEQTLEVGRKLGRLLSKGDIVCLTGDLGTGKTAFANGIAKALGIDGYITSPTFTIVNEYMGTIPFYHFDVYRISDSDEMYEIGFEEYISGAGVVVIEWADLIRDILPEDVIWVHISKDLYAGRDIRIINMQFTGKRYETYEDRL